MRATQQKPKTKQNKTLCLHLCISELFMHIFRALIEPDSGQLFPVCLSHQAVNSQSFSSL